MINIILTGWVYFLIATGKIFPFDENDSSVHILVGGGNLCLFFLLMTVNKRYRELVVKSFAWMMPIFLLMLVSMIGSRDVAYGFSKIEGAVFVSVAAASLVGVLVERLGNIKFLQYFVGFSSLMLIATIFQRAAQGLGGREGLFLFNGAILFGSLMGMNFLASFYLFYLTRLKYYIFLSACFVGAVLWTQSKGPLVAVFLAGFFLYLYCFGREALSFKFILKVVFGFVIVFLFYEYVFDYFSTSDSRLLALVRILKGEMSDSDSGSVDVRVGALVETFSLWLDYPFFGVGIGNWGYYLGSDGLKYPHNILGETVSEFGLFGFFVVFCFFSVLFLRSRVINKVFLLHFFICLSFSGDASYWRLIIFYPLSYLILSQLVKGQLNDNGGG